jgi:ribonuclease P protein component
MASWSACVPRVAVQLSLHAAPRVASVWLPDRRAFGGVDQTFARRYRLTRTDEFSSVFGFRRAIRGSLLTLHYQPRAAGLHDARLGLVIGKKLLKRAVDRNRARRVIREQFRRQRSQLPACDLVVRLAAKPDPFDGKFLAADLLSLLVRLQRQWRPRGGQ